MFQSLYPISYFKETYKLKNTNFKKRPKRDKPGPGYQLVHTKTIRLRDGRILRAENYGIKCFTFWAKPSNN